MATRTKQTYTTYKAALASYGGLPFTCKNLLSYIEDQRKRGKSETTIKLRLSTIGQYLKYAQKDTPELMRIISGFKTCEKHQPCPSDDDIEAIADAISNPLCKKRASKKYLAILFLAAENGLRVSEISGILMKDYDGARVILRHTKNHTDAPVHLTSRAKEVVNEYVVGHRINSAPTLFTCEHGRMSVNTIQVQMKRYMEAAGCGKFHMHSLRRYYANRLVRANVNPVVIQECMRHKNLASTQKYLNIDGQQVKEAIESAFDR